MAVIRPEEINSRESFEAWLVSLSGPEQFQTSLVLASRSALRVLPLIYDVPKLGSRHNPYEAMVLGAFRANMISRVAIKFPADEIANAANLHFAAADFSRQADSSNASNSAYFAAATASAVQGNFAAAAATNAISFAELAQNSVVSNLAAVDDLSKIADLSDLAEFWKTLSAEALAIEQGANPVSLSYQALWSGTPPNWWQDAMKEFERLLKQLYFITYHIPRDNYWPRSRPDPANFWLIWLEWYKSIANGQPSFGLPVTIADELDKQIALGFGIEDFWDSDPIIINAEVAEWVKEAKASAALAHEQGNGLQFEWRDGLVRLARGLGLSSPKDDQRRIEVQLPVLLELVTKLEGRMASSGVPRPEALVWAVTNLKKTISRKGRESIGATELFTASAILRSQIEQARSPTIGTNLFALDGPDLALSQSIALASDMIVLATEEGRKLFDDADTAETDAGELDRYRELEKQLFAIIAANGNVMEASAIELLGKVLLLDRNSPHPKRMAYLSAGSVRNAILVTSIVSFTGAIGYALVSVTAPSAMAAAAMVYIGKLVFGEGFKKSKLGELSNHTITNAINKVTAQVIIDNRELLRKIAGDRPSYKSLRDLLDWVDEEEKKKTQKG